MYIWEGVRKVMAAFAESRHKPEPTPEPKAEPTRAEVERQAWRAAAVERRLAAANAANATRRARAEIDADARGGDR